MYAVLSVDLFSSSRWAFDFHTSKNYFDVLFWLACSLKKKIHFMLIFIIFGRNSDPKKCTWGGHFKLMVRKIKGKRICSIKEQEEEWWNCRSPQEPTGDRALHSWAPFRLLVLDPSSCWGSRIPACHHHPHLTNQTLRRRAYKAREGLFSKILLRDLHLISSLPFCIFPLYFPVIIPS